MSLPKGNEFLARISVPAQGTRPATTWGVEVTPGNNAYGTAVELVASNHATWSGNGDGRVVDVHVNSNQVSATARDGLVTIVFRRVISGVDTTDNELDFAAPHGFDTADVFRLTTSAADPPDPLAAGTIYYVIPRSPTSIALATSEANARAGTAIDITDAGTGTHTAHVDKLQYLSAASADTTTIGGGGYPFDGIPIFVPNGTAIDAKATVNNATVGTLFVAITVHLAATKPWTLRTGTYFRAFGIDPATSQGTDLTWGTTDEGALTELGTIADDDLFHWMAGFAVDSGSMNAIGYEIDIAVGANSGSAVVAIEGVRVTTSTSERVSLYDNRGWVLEATNGHKVFARGQSSGTAATGSGAMAYAVGGRFVPPGLYTVAGTVTISGAPAANGKIVQIFAVDADDIAELVDEATVAGGAGAYTVEVPENVRTYFASYVDGASVGRSVNGTAGTSTFDITIGGGGGGYSRGRVVN